MSVENWLWYANVMGFCAANTGLVLQEYDTPLKLLEMRGNADIPKLTKGQAAIACATEPREFIRLAKECEDKGVGIVTYADKEYPIALRDIPSAPPVLYYKGDINLLNNSFLFAMIGARRPSGYGMEITAQIAKELAENGVIIVSGMASGLDSEAHKMALGEHMATVACLAFGHDYCYPASNRSLLHAIEFDGLTISEYPPNTGAQKQFFLERNRIIAGLSRGVCIAEARKASGTMNTVQHALEYGKDVFSVPGSVFSELSDGTNQLIKEGAIPVTQARDIIEYYALEYKSSVHKEELPQFTLSADAKNTLKLLSQMPTTLEALCGISKISPARMMASLTELEISGKARQEPGRQFVISKG
ncbi:MAG: DNA-processing protein DprA [Oscillospiraceae bacterium]